MRPNKRISWRAGALGAAATLNLLATALLAQAPSPDWPADSVAVRTALRRFLVAFENLDWEAFRSSFDDSATVFFPTPDTPERFAGRPAFEARFQQVFAETRRAAPGGPPFQRLVPEDLRLSPLALGAALVTFHLRNSERLARRTLVFKKTRGDWRIVHLHASNVPRR